MADRMLRVGAVVLAVVVFGGGTVIVVERLAPSAASAPVTASVAIGTATVVRTDLSTTTQVDGTLGYAGSYLLDDQATGVYTALPEPGSVLQRGQPVYEVSGRPVVLFFGARPAWRDLSIGVPAGPDVVQLKQNLLALGFASPSTMVVNERFDGATAAAVRRWQARLGVPVTGTVGVGDVLYAPGPIRVDSVQATLGGQARPGPVVQATGTDPVVNLSVPVTQEYLVKVGDPVSVLLPDGKTTTPGTITAVAPVASTATTPSGGPGGGTGQNGGPAQVAVTVRLADPAAAGSLDQAPVQVGITDQSVRGVLAVPINALVALAEGGYGVWVRDRGARRLVGVTTGLFSDSLVQVSGAGLAPGVLVEVPAS
jgi:hypothetical protein